MYLSEVKISEFSGDKGLREKDITTTKDVKIIKSFSDMKLKPLLLRGIYAFGFKSPSAIQQRAIAPLIKGRDIIAQAQSGTGKTATFSIGLLQRIDENFKKPQALVLSPTRELSLQITKVLLSLGDYLNIQCHACYGGTDLKRDIEKIKLGVHVLSGTPGRVYDMIQRGALNVKSIKMLILDEADEMLNKGFQEKISEVYKYLPDLTQVCLVSATLPDEILEISEKFMTDPIKILVKRDELTVDAIKQFYLDVEKEEWKFDNLCYFITETIKFTHIIIFCNKRRKVDWLTKKLKDAKFSVSSLHGKIKQKDREDIMNKLRTFQTRVLVTTDLCARGIDVKQISVVINFDLPTSREIYIHRIGRSGRFGKKSIAITLIKNEDKPILEDLRKNYKMKLEPLPKNFIDFI